MKRHILLTLALCIGCMAGIASAAPKDDQPGKNRVIPVLVNVNTKGEVTDVAPAYKLHPAFARALHDTLQKMITKPAMQNGKPVSCQFLLGLELDTVAQTGGKYNVNFKYLYSKALPPGGWYWVHGSGHDLALASQSGQQSTIPFTGSWLQKIQQMNDVMGFHATDPLTRQ